MNRCMDGNRGFSLIIVLLMLVAISLLGVSSYTVVTSSSRSASTWSDRQRALGFTESGLKLAESEINGWIKESGALPLPSGARDYYKNREDVTSVTPFPVSGIKSMSVGDVIVKYMIVYEGKVGTKDRLTVYAQSAGARDKTNSVVSATYEVGE